MTSAPLRMASAMVVEIGGVLLALALLPGLPWQQWKAALASNDTTDTAEIPPPLPPSGYGFQLDNQAAVQPDRSVAPRTVPAPTTQPRTFAAPPAVTEQRPSATQDRRVTPLLPDLPPEPQRREYVAQTLDRASQQILDSLAQPWSADSTNSAAVTERDLPRRNELFRAPPPPTGANEQQYLRPEYPSTPPNVTLPNAVPNANLPSSPLPNNPLPSATFPSQPPAAPSSRFGTPSAAQPLQRSQPLPQPVIPLEPAAPKFQSDIAPQSFTAPQPYSTQQPFAAPPPAPQNYAAPQAYSAPRAAQTPVVPPPSYYSQQRASQFDAEKASFVERAPISNEYYAPRNVTTPSYGAPPANSSGKVTGPTHVRPAGPRHVQY